MRRRFCSIAASSKAFARKFRHLDVQPRSTLGRTLHGKGGKAAAATAALILSARAVNGGREGEGGGRRCKRREGRRRRRRAGVGRHLEDANRRSLSNALVVPMTETRRESLPSDEVGRELGRDPEAARPKRKTQRGRRRARAGWVGE